MANGNGPKPGYHTTEFWVTVLCQLVGLLAFVSPTFITTEQANVLVQAITQLGGIVAMIASAFGYSLSRGIAKKNSQ